VAENQLNLSNDLQAGENGSGPFPAVGEVPGSRRGLDAVWDLSNSRTLCVKARTVSLIYI
jgi:hypothetical protein